MSEHEIAPRTRAHRMRERVVVRRSANDGDQQRDLGGIEFGKRFVEVELAAETEAVHCALAVLPEIDLVDVGVQQIGFLITRVENHRHRELFQLAPQRAAVVEEIALHELLRQRAAALRQIAGTDVGERGACDAFQVEPGVRVEVAVFDGLQTFAQQNGCFFRRDDQAVFAVRREETADHRWFEPHETRGLAVFVQRVDRVIGDAHANVGGCTRTVAERECTQRGANFIAGVRVRARRIRRPASIAEPLQLHLDFVGLHLEPGIQLDRLRIHARGHRPAPTIERRRDHMIEIQQVPRDERDTEARDDQQVADDQALTSTLRRRFGFLTRHTPSGLHRRRILRTPSEQRSDFAKHGSDTAPDLGQQPP